MKLIIIEGTDNSGKDTLINNLCNHYINEKIEVKHFEKPKSKTNEECAKEQDKSFIDFVKSLDASEDKIVILNRAWYGELVYGTLYRGRNKNEVLSMIWECEKILIDSKIDVSYILLYADPVFLSKNEDGLSISKGDPDLIDKEDFLFIQSLNKSILSNKKLIEVNIGGKWVKPEKILEKTINLVENGK